MSLTDAAETNLLKLIFQNIAWANIGDVGGLQPSAAAGSLYISLHTADPGETGNQTTSEATYTGYARVAVARSAVGWTVTGNTTDNADEILFGSATAGSSTVTFFGVGTALTGVGNLIASGALTTALAVTVGVQPRFVIGDLNVTAD